MSDRGRVERVNPELEKRLASKGRVDPELVERLASADSQDLMGLLQNGTPDEQRQAAIELGDRGETRARDQLITLLHASDLAVGDGAALGLLALGDVSVVPPLLAAIRERRSKGIRSSPLVYAVIGLDPHQAIPELVDLLMKGTYIEVRHAGVGLRLVWDELAPTEQEGISRRLQERLHSQHLEDWRADWIDEILTEGGYTPEERREYMEG